MNSLNSRHVEQIRYKLGWTQEMMEDFIAELNDCQTVDGLIEFLKYQKEEEGMKNYITLDIVRSWILHRMKQ